MLVEEVSSCWVVFSTVSPPGLVLSQLHSAE